MLIVALLKSLFSFLSSFMYIAWAVQFSCTFIPKFHCELNLIERVWSQSKRYTVYHWITSTKHSSGAEECFKGEHCELCASLQELLFAYLEGSAVGQELEEKIKVYKSANITQESWLMTNFIDDRKQQISSCVLFCQDTTPAMVKWQLYVTRP